MNTFQHDELFHRAGPSEALDYLWGRLQDRDLSQAEALALLSAVHHALGAAPAADPKVYLAYTRFMESLGRDMPVVHDYVVSHWIVSRREGRTQGREGSASDVAPTADEDGRALSYADTRPAPVPSSPGAFPWPVAPRVGRGEEPPEEPGEPEDHARTQPRSLGGPGKGSDPEGEDDALEQAEQVSGKETEAGDQPEQADELTGEAEAAESEAAEAQVSEAEASASEAEPVEPAESAEPSAEAESEQPEAEQGSGQEPADAAGGEKAGGEEGEWPAQEEPGPAEPTEEMEGEGDEPSPVN